MRPVRSSRVTKAMVSPRLDFMVRTPPPGRPPAGAPGTAELADAGRDEAGEFLLVFIDRVPGEIEPQGVLLAGQALLVGPLAHLAVVGIDVASSSGLKRLRRTCPSCPGSGWPGSGRGLQGVFHGGGAPRGPAQVIQRPGADQRLQGALVHALGIDPTAEVEQVAERPRPPRGPRRWRRSGPRRRREWHPGHRPPALLIDGKLVAADVDIRRGHGQPLSGDTPRSAAPPCRGCPFQWTSPPP